MFKPLFLVVALSLSTTVVSAEENLCVREICLGDGIQELMKIKWEPVFKDRAPDISHIKSINQLLITDAKTAYFLGRLSFIVPEFDNEALKALANVRGFCKATGFKGEFTSPTGNKTTVDIAPIFPGHGAAQKLAVVRIRRDFVKITSRQKEALAQEIASKYGAYYKTYSPPGGGPYVHFDNAGWAGADGWLVLELNDNDPQRQQKLEDFPGCTKPVHLD